MYLLPPDLLLLHLDNTSLMQKLLIHVILSSWSEGWRAVVQLIVTVATECLEEEQVSPVTPALLECPIYVLRRVPQS